LVGCGCGLNSGLCTCKGVALWLKTRLQSILLSLIWRWSLRNYLSKQTWNCNPPDLSLPNS
jgi:hypothetical protein